MVAVPAKPAPQLPQHHDLRVVYFGMLGQFSIPPLLALLETGYQVSGVIVPSPDSRLARPSPDLAELKPATVPTLLPVVNPYVNKNIVHIAWERGIPVFEVRRLAAPTTLATLRSLQPDVGCVACFSRRLPPALLELPAHGFFNVHPSLLPAYPGPAPLFWTFHDDAARGVSIHIMEEDLDTGAVVAQEPVLLPEGINGEHADQRLATQGGQLLVEVLQSIRAGTLTRRPQGNQGPPAPWPTADDFEVSPAWPARRIFNFMRATAEWEQPYPIAIAGQRLLLGAALAYAPDATLAGPFQQLGQTIRIQCNPGVLEAALA
jgi:methionyl-tRNA formyltransferase